MIKNLRLCVWTIVLLIVFVHTSYTEVFVIGESHKYNACYECSIAITDSRLYLSRWTFEQNASTVHVYDHALKRIPEEERFFENVINRDFPPKDQYMINQIESDAGKFYIEVSPPTIIPDGFWHTANLDDYGMYVYSLESGELLNIKPDWHFVQKFVPAQQRGIKSVKSTSKRVYNLSYRHWDNNDTTRVYVYRHDGLRCEDEDIAGGFPRVQFESMAVGPNENYMFFVAYGASYMKSVLNNENEQVRVHTRPIELHRHPIIPPMQKYDDLVFVSDQTRPEKPVDTKYPSWLITNMGNLKGVGGIAVTCDGLYITNGGVFGYRTHRYGLNGKQKYPHSSTVSSGKVVGMTANKNNVYFVTLPYHNETHTLVGIKRELTRDMLRQGRIGSATQVIVPEGYIIQGMSLSNAGSFFCFVLSSTNNDNSAGKFQKGKIGTRPELVYDLHINNKNPTGLCIVDDRVYVLDVYRGDDARTKVFVYEFYDGLFGNYLPDESFELGWRGGEGIGYTDNNFYIFHQYKGVSVYGETAPPVWRRKGVNPHYIKLETNEPFEENLKWFLGSGSPAPEFQFRQGWDKPLWIDMNDRIISGVAPDIEGVYNIEISAVNSEGYSNQTFRITVKRPVVVEKPEPEPEPIINILAAPAIPIQTKLLVNYPNPFNPETWIPYQLSQPGYVIISIHDTQSRLVRRIDLGYQPAGKYTDKGKAVYWDGKNGIGEQVSAGIYFCTLNVGDYSQTIRMMIVK